MFAETLAAGSRLLACTCRLESKAELSAAHGLLLEVTNNDCHIQQHNKLVLYS